MKESTENSVVEETEQEIINWILDTVDELRTDEGYCLKATMDLPPMSRVDNSVLINCIEAILAQFNISIPPDILRELSENSQHEAVFLAPSIHKELRPRTVSINTSADIRAIFIRGEPPIDGKDGKIEVHFDYTEKPGRLLPDGTIDFRNINKFPQVKEGQVLLNIYEPTRGTPGTDVYGGHVPPKEGRAFEVEAGDGIRVERKYDDEEKRYFNSYLAEKAGIVICHFEGDIRDAFHLRQVEIKNQITVKDIDFSTGNIGDAVEEIRCVADVTVNGDIKGSFVVIIEGNLEVRGAVEGEKVDVSGDLKASFVRSSVRIGKKAEIGSALNATLKSDELIVVEREVARCVIRCPNLIFQPKGTPTVLIGQCQARVLTLNARGVEIRSHFVVILGEELLKQLDQLNKRRDAVERELEGLSVEFKDKATIFIQKIKMLNGIAQKVDDKELIFLQEVGTKLLKGEIGHEETRALLAKWGSIENPGNLTILKALTSLIETREDEERLSSELEAIGRQEEGIKEQLSRMYVQLEGSLKGSGKLEVVCGRQVLKWQADASGKNTPISIEVRYVLGKGLVEG